MAGKVSVGLLLLFERPLSCLYHLVHMTATKMLAAGMIDFVRDGMGLDFILRSCLVQRFISWRLAVHCA